MDSTLYETTFFELTLRLTGWGLCTLFFSTIAVGYYVMRAYTGKQPVMRSAWIIILTLDTVAFISDALYRGAFSVLVAVFIVGAILICLISISKGRFEWTTTDKICSIMATIAIVGMFIFPQAGLWISVFGLLCGVWPMCVGLYRKTHSETMWTWSLIFTSNIFAWFEGQHDVAIGFGTIQALVIVLELRRRFTVPKIQQV
ncbi:hypothetical protein HQ403_01020 [Candidatus Kaiserbacteria bacterium]|nr:hypothetical protein [Candidatus Kaiserbacteria bacterium]